MTIPSENVRTLQQEAIDENTSRDRLQELAACNLELAQLVASNSNAPAELLAKIATSSDITICRHVTANPNTPTEILLELGKKFPKRAAQQPCLFSANA